MFLDTTYDKNVWTEFERLAMTTCGRKDHIIPVMLDAETGGFIGLPLEYTGRLDLSYVWSHFLENNDVSANDVDLIKAIVIRPMLDLLG